MVEPPNCGWRAVRRNRYARCCDRWMVFASVRGKQRESRLLWCRRVHDDRPVLSDAVSFARCLGDRTTLATACAESTCAGLLEARVADSSLLHLFFWRAFQSTGKRLVGRHKHLARIDAVAV